jgi:apolipoprotein N-acyltransferase
LRIGVVQTESHNGEELAALNAEATEEGADIVVWPELSGQTMARIDISQLSEIASRDGQAPFATTFNEAGERLPYNVASVFSRDGESLRYRKRKPFAGEVNIHAAGTDAVAVEIDGVRYGLNICFDSCFPAVMLDTASLGVDAILLPTLDPIAPYGTIQAMHSAYTPFRAAELGVPIARADITAYSMVVDGRGVIVAEAGSGTTEVDVGTVEVGERWTLYKQWGDWFLYLCGVIAVAGVLVDRRKTVRRPVDSE